MKAGLIHACCMRKDVPTPNKLKLHDNLHQMCIYRLS
jgi:hypothetical protein